MRTRGGVNSRMHLLAGSLHSTETSRVEEGSRQTEVAGGMKLRWLEEDG